VERAGDVVLVRAERILDGARHRAHRRLVVDHPDAARRADQHRKIPDVSADHLEPAAELGGEREVGPRSGREVVEDPNAAAVGEEPLDEMGADETGTTRHEHEIVHSSIVSSAARDAARSRRGSRLKPTGAVGALTLRKSARYVGRTCR